MRAGLLVQFLCAPLALLACARERPVVERLAGVQVVLPPWPERRVADDPAAGLVERALRGEGRVLLGWEADARSGPPDEDEALLVAGLGDRSHLVRGSGGGTLPLPREVELVAGHPAALVAAEGTEALVWRCGASGRLFHLLRAGPRAPPLERLAAGVQCHRPGEHPVEGEVPRASATVLGAAFRLAHRSPASATWLHADAALTLFAAQLAPPPQDAAAAARLAQAWARAAGLQGAVVRRQGQAEGPLGHRALRIAGEATQGGSPVRWTLLWWRCPARGRTYAALVVARAPLLPVAGGAAAGLEPDWTGRDAALLAARCHG